ncbi:ATP-binding protein [Paenibacillus sp. P22]|uniref:ATP-binding protein n=1 Tax=Paenibacillus sp. P22 TaxID=483908 RepID=UPI000435C7AC|nr:ATP-binding protein [Paenibacillus sp. P22]CDN44227.1 hypothetical protein BN871_EL_00040 [Paenibacillus sp. P22]
MNVIHIEEVNPNLDNFVKSIRDIGYSTQIAVADIIDNSIAAKAKNIDIVAVTIPYMTLAILDDGLGMNEEELKEAMRLATKSPDDIRNKDDLGRFGLGLKTASFSQCKTLTVISKKNDQLFLRQWDLDYLAKENRWLLITPDESDYEDFPLYKKLAKQKKRNISDLGEYRWFYRGGLSTYY